MQGDRRLKRKVRNSYIVSTISISLVLFLLGSVGYVIMSIMGATDRMKESVSVYVMLNDGIEATQKEELEARLLKHEAVREVTYVSKEQAAEDFRKSYRENFEEFLGYNPLPDLYDVKLSTTGSQSEVLRDFEAQVTLWEGVDEIFYQKEVVESISTNINKFNLVLLMFGGGLLFISLILLNNTIRVTVFSKRYIISTMKLVGATRGFIMKPFLRSAFMQGIYSGLVAIIMFAALVWGLHEGLPEVRFASLDAAMIWISGGMLLTGIIISVLVTAVAVNKFVKMPTGAIYFY